MKILTFKSIARSNVLKAYLLVGLITACGLYPVLRSSWLGDDWPISQTPYWIQWRYGELDFQKILQEALYWNDQWMRGAGRFYPMTWVESRFTFAYLTGMQEYKIFQFSLLLTLAVLLTFYIFRLTKSHTQSLIALIILPIFLQFRRDFDPHVAFANMLSSLLIKFLIASILLTYINEQKKKTYKILISVLSAIFYLGALCTYEFAFLLLPALLLSVQQKKDETIKQKLKAEVKEIFSKFLNPYLIPTITVWLIYGIFVFFILRPQATAISGAYSLGISFNSIWVFLSQIFTATPLITLRMDDLKFISRNLMVLALIFLLIRYLINKIMSQNLSRWENQKFKAQQNFDIRNAMIGFNLLAAPGLMLAMQPVWWGRADLFHSYLGVMISEIGMVILVAQCISWCLTKKNQTHDLKSKK